MDRRLDLRIRARQTGVSLFLALIALLALILAGVALVRSVNTGTIVIGNLGFQQDATVSSDQATEQAITWLQNNFAATINDASASGYYATSLDILDPTGNSNATTRALVDWNNDGCAYAASGSFTACLTPYPANPSAGISVNGNRAQYLIARLCQVAGDPNATGNTCAKPPTGSGSGSPKRGELKYGEDKRFSGSITPYFRVVVRTSGARNTFSYTETIVHF